MEIITVNPNARTLSTGQYSHISPTPTVKSPYAPSIVFIGGPLPKGRWLAPVLVQIVEEEREEGEDREFVVTEPKYYMHGVGETVSDAVDAFKRIISQYLDGLTARENHLSPQMHDQLKYLRSVIRISQ